MVWLRWNRFIGWWGERRAVRYLQRTGYRVIERNWRGDSGEVDLVALTFRTLVFVEVKTRFSEHLSMFPLEQAVDDEKRDRQPRIAREYLDRLAPRDRRLLPKRLRFDVVYVSFEKSRFGLPRQASLSHEEGDP